MNQFINENIKLKIFKDYLREYDYWGHCDIDTILGDLNHYIPFEKLQEYDRIFTEGHMTLYKNNEKVNNYFRTLSALDCQNYKNVYTTDDVRCFDEWVLIKEMVYHGFQKKWHKTI